MAAQLIDSRARGKVIKVKVPLGAPASQKHCRLGTPPGTRGRDSAIPRRNLGMQTLRNAREQSQKDGVAIGHFNVSDLVLLKAVVAAARDLKVPVAVGAS